MTNFNFGWVANNVTGNFTNWSSWQSTGSQEDASSFYDSTADDATGQGLVWFCQPVD